MDDHELQQHEVNKRLGQQGHPAVTEDELKLITGLLKDSLLAELENLKDEDLTFSTKTQTPPPGERTILENEPSECVICGSTIKEFGHYSMEFGTQIRKRANMCGLDCTSEFIDALRESKGLETKR